MLPRLLIREPAVVAAADNVLLDRQRCGWGRRRRPIDTAERAITQVDEYVSVFEIAGPHGSGLDGRAFRGAERFAELGIPPIRREAERSVVIARGISALDVVKPAVPGKNGNVARAV